MRLFKLFLFAISHQLCIISVNQNNPTPHRTFPAKRHYVNRLKGQSFINCHQPLRDHKFSHKLRIKRNLSPTHVPRTFMALHSMWKFFWTGNQGSLMWGPPGSMVAGTFQKQLSCRRICKMIPFYSKMYIIHLQFCYYWLLLY